MNEVSRIFQTMEYGPAPESAAAVRAWLASKSSGFGLFIGGEFRAPAEPGERIDSINPANGERLASFSMAGAKDIDLAVDTARAAFTDWAKRPCLERARYLYALARAVQKASRFLAVLETLDNGKPIRETRDIDIPLVARHFYAHAGWAQLRDQEFPGFEPLGVIGQIVPWNFPLLMLAWKIAPALAAGNCVVLKPAEQTSLTALYFAELCQEAGLPPGVVNIVTGGPQTGELIVAHPKIAKIAFTGSTEVGRLIRQSTAGSGKALSLELGGKSPFIIFEDADLDSAVEGLVDGIWFNQGQVCCAGSRALVEESVAAPLIDKIKRRLQSFRIGDPLEKTVDMGAIIDPAQKSRIEGLVACGVSEGATLWQPQIALPALGSFYPPTLLTDVAPANIVMREEIFGPVVALTTFRTLSEAVTLANNTRYGLAASIWTETIGRALEVAGGVKAGVVWINTTNEFDASCGFGGYRESGFGREGGIEGFRGYLKVKEERSSAAPAVVSAPDHLLVPDAESERIDRTAKNFIGGEQKRPDGGSTLVITDSRGAYAGRVPNSDRKDIRDAVEAADRAAGWGRTAPHSRAQILYYIAENLSGRAREFAALVAKLTGVSARDAAKQVALAQQRLFSYGAWADKYEGVVHTVSGRKSVIALNEPIGIVAIVCPDSDPLLSFLSLLAPVIAMGNRCVIVPSERWPLIAAELALLFQASDVPPGVINIITGRRDILAPVLAAHDGVDALWYHGTQEGSAAVERLSVGNMKRIWTNGGGSTDWRSSRMGEGRRFLEQATQVKNIWLPFGE